MRGSSWRPTPDHQPLLQLTSTNLSSTDRLGVNHGHHQPLLQLASTNPSSTDHFGVKRGENQSNERGLRGSPHAELRWRCCLRRWSSSRQRGAFACCYVGTVSMALRSWAAERCTVSTALLIVLRRDIRPRQRCSLGCGAGDEFGMAAHASAAVKTIWSALWVGLHRWRRCGLLGGMPAAAAGVPAPVAWML